MSGRAIVVLDVGKTLSKLSLWSADGRLLANAKRPNDRLDTGSYVCLDSAGIEEFLFATLKEFASSAQIGAIIPVGHGAGAAIINSRGIVLPPLDYEHPIPHSLR